MLYYPLSGFLTLFANILHDPEGSHTASDLQLIRLVTSFVSPLVTEASPFMLSASIRLLTELENVATRVVERANSQSQYLTTTKAIDAPPANNTKHSIYTGSIDDSFPTPNSDPGTHNLGVSINLMHCFCNLIACSYSHSAQRTLPLSLT